MSRPVVLKRSFKVLFGFVSNHLAFHDVQRARQPFGDVLVDPVIGRLDGSARALLIFKDADCHQFIAADVDGIITNKPPVFC